ncbi:MAG: choice-of-anchor L domain-containing protein, partial [Flavobacteriales bacterium]|nr:choice-of-anchor L domain-containing protein [Flavobacteriales bacterium]
MKTKKLLLILSILLGGFSYGQNITVENVLTPEELVQNVLVGSGVTISNVEFNYSVPLATSVQTMVGFFDGVGTSWALDSGLVIATGNCALAAGDPTEGNTLGNATDNSGVAPDPNDPDLDAIGTATINNEAILEFDFIPEGDSVVFNYIFASEEYNEYVGSAFNDVFG